MNKGKLKVSKGEENKKDKVHQVAGREIKKKTEM